MRSSRAIHESHRLVEIRAGRVTLEGDLAISDAPRGIVIFAHGSGSSRHSPRNQFVAEALRNGANVATLLFDLLSAEEEAIDAQTGELRFDIDLLAERLGFATDWARNDSKTRDLPIGYFGASTGAAAALVAAARRPEQIAAIVSRGGRPDLAGQGLERVRAPTLLIVGGLDYVVLAMNRSALSRIPAEKALEVVPGASHLFEEADTLADVAYRAVRWYKKFLSKNSSAPARGGTP